MYFAINTFNQFTKTKLAKTLSKSKYMFYAITFDASLPNTELHFVFSIVT